MIGLGTAPQVNTHGKTNSYFIHPANSLKVLGLFALNLLTYLKIRILFGNSKINRKRKRRHEIYKVSKDALENIYEGYNDYSTQTYDAEEDQSVYEPYELNLKINDLNNDGYNDIMFEGNLVLTMGLAHDSIWYDNEIRQRHHILFHCSSV